MHYLFLFSFFFFSSLPWKKYEDGRTFRISYKVIETTSHTPSYHVSYSGENGVTHAEGPFTSEEWTSAMIRDKGPGDFVLFKVESNAGVGRFILSVYVNGYLWQEQRIDHLPGSCIISGRLPD